MVIIPFQRYFHGGAAADLPAGYFARHLFNPEPVGVV